MQCNSQYKYHGSRLFKNTDLIFCVKNYFLEFEILASGTENFKKKICFLNLYRLTGCREKNWFARYFKTHEDIYFKSQEKN